MNWQFFPKSDYPPPLLEGVVELFRQSEGQIGSGANTLQSDRVLEILRPGLAALGFRVEAGKKPEDKIPVPVLYGLNGILLKSYNADAVHEEGRVVLEVEAGRALDNNQIYKDLFQACLMQEIDYLILAVRTTYRRSGNFQRAADTFETLYVSRRLSLPLKGVLLIGY